MKKLIQSFGDFTRRRVNEDHFFYPEHERSEEPGMATASLEFGPFGYFTQVSYGGQNIKLGIGEEYVSDEDILDAAKELGASGERVKYFDDRGNERMIGDGYSEHDWAD